MHTRFRGGLQCLLVSFECVESLGTLTPSAGSASAQCSMRIDGSASIKRTIPLPDTEFLHVG
jgi:hypothetical protein